VALTCLTFERGALGGGLGINVEQLQRLAGQIPAGSAVARDRWAASMTEFEISRWTEMRAQAARRAGRPPGPEDSGSKLRGTAMIKRLAALGLQVEGAAATASRSEAGEGETGRSDDEWQSMFLMSPSLSIRGGTDEIQRNILGERVLGLPPEPRVDKDKPFSDTV
jgi:alkylation response protein AidB-like acyl-CoA dehydrogenase